MCRIRRARLTTCALLVACGSGDDWKPSRPGEIFRYTVVGSVPFDTVSLGRPWLSGSKYGAGPADTLTALPAGTFSGADAIVVRRDATGVVTQIDFAYLASRDVDALVADYRQTLGAPGAIETDTVSGTARTTMRWRSDDTEFVIRTLSPPDKLGVAARASLIDRAKPSR